MHSCEENNINEYNYISEFRIWDNIPTTTLTLGFSFWFIWSTRFHCLRQYVYNRINLIFTRFVLLLLFVYIHTTVRSKLQCQMSLFLSKRIMYVTSREK